MQGHMTTDPALAGTFKAIDESRSLIVRRAISMPRFLPPYFLQDRFLLTRSDGTPIEAISTACDNQASQVKQSGTAFMFLHWCSHSLAMASDNNRHLTC
jgi:hypothetical protein